MREAPSYLSPSGQEIVFLLLGAVVVGSALLVVTTRRLVHAALWLVVSLGGLAGCYLVLTAEFVAWVQVLIYVGAVVVLLLFGIMLTRAPVGPSENLDSGNRRLAALVALATAALLVTVVVEGFRTAYAPLGPAAAGAVKPIGASIFRAWVLPFEALSVLLLAALIGAIVLSRTDIARPRSDPLRVRPATGVPAATSPNGPRPAPPPAQPPARPPADPSGSAAPGSAAAPGEPRTGEARPAPAPADARPAPDPTPDPGSRSASDPGSASGPGPGSGAASGPGPGSGSAPGPGPGSGSRSVSGPGAAGDSEGGGS
ncbi:NADH-quinone oxidoreductase subunit J [Bailinhaonella thermotolerans]|uniref:NADH-quinone oxidoreductase subunit J family protein n=1 Tax=Bailinhaonella thermotolerans TaxID=1070861 RepID=UPI001F5C0545|nr:NADH-quinone oxidoreductase subunit J [Bailinhaonella thermotolerans]